MEISFSPIKCKDNDVMLIENCTSLIGDLQKALNIESSSNHNLTEVQHKIIDSILHHRILHRRDEAWQMLCKDGKECSVLQVGAPNWIKGKIRIKLVVEFAPDEHEIPDFIKDDRSSSPLEDLRRSIGQIN